MKSSRWSGFSSDPPLGDPPTWMFWLGVTIVVAYLLMEALT